MRGMESGLGCGEDRLSPLPFILRYSLADDTDSSLLSKLSSFLLVTSVMASVLTTPSGAHATKCAAGLHNPHQAFLLEFFFLSVFLNLGQEPNESNANRKKCLSTMSIITIAFSFLTETQSLPVFMLCKDKIHHCLQICPFTC